MMRLIDETPPGQKGIISGPLIGWPWRHRPGEVENPPANDPQYADPGLVYAAWLLGLKSPTVMVFCNREGQLVADNIKANSALAGLELKLTEKLWC